MRDLTAQEIINVSAAEKLSSSQAWEEFGTGLSLLLSSGLAGAVTGQIIGGIGGYQFATKIMGTQALTGYLCGGVGAGIGAYLGALSFVEVAMNAYDWARK
jgi:hypothetical protein